jgi:hypothetical protein
MARFSQHLELHCIEFCKNQGRIAVLESHKPSSTRTTRSNPETPVRLKDEEGTQEVANPSRVERIERLDGAKSEVSTTGRSLAPLQAMGLRSAWVPGA